ncbi:hypothetical protein Ahy_B06g081511 isoform B [Arachis hypogaea]|uniref:Dof zinc finger protein n=1 Tax=Arachis hypogaea TaxID=3818 RepID=A0A444YLD7_ARAHY|nr:hypothetical protein Ahy_B06g081511 isoform B [Arachis hypogaea]
MEGISANSSCTARPVLEKKARPQEQLNCPRCNSTNTKFCYYNNYSLTQPRYFCKTCRRYWTEGGSLRNVPVGGGSRKNKKIISSSASSSSSSLSSSSAPKVPDLNPPSLAAQNPNNKMMQGGGHDLNLAFPAMENFHHHALSAYVEIPKLETGGGGGGGDGSSSTAAAAPSSLSAIELLRSSGMAAPRGGLNNIPYVHSSLMPNSNALYPSGFPMQEIKPSLGFSLVDGLGSNGGQVENNDNHNNGRLLFPFGVELDQNNKQQAGNNSTGYWTGIIGEGSSW